MASPDPGLSLYLHVPFCTDKCLYCDFFSVPRGSVPPSVITRVVEQTVELAQTLWDASGRAPLRTLFIGGGTPSCLPPSLLRRLLGPFVGQGVVEWTVESNPETLSQAFLDECEAAGVTRLSLGIQSLSSELLQRVRRRATREQSLSAIDLLRRKWRGQVNLDFITGIPGQTQDDVGECLSVIQPQWPDHVSLYQLTVEPGTPLEAGVADRSIRLNEPEKDEDLWLAGREGLLSRGFRQYEVSNFARPGRECRHNVRYWMIQPYAGAGPGAVSTIPSAWASRLAGLMLPTASSPVVRLSAPKDLPLFLAGRERFWGVEVEAVERSDFLLEVLMMGLRLSDGIPSGRMEEVFGAPFARLFPGLWERWEAAGNALPAGERLQLTASGLLVLDHLLEEVAERAPSAWTGAPVRWP